MRIEDIEVKRDNAQKLIAVETQNIPSNEIVTAEEFNCLIAEIIELKSQIGREQRTEQFLIDVSHLQNNKVVLPTQAEPIKSSLLVAVRGTIISPSDIDVNGNQVIISKVSVEYGVELGDTVVVHYQSKS